MKTQPMQEKTAQRTPRNELVALRQRVAELESSETERKQAAQVSTEQAVDLKAIVDTIATGLMRLDREMVVRWVNGPMAAMFGFRPAEMLGRLWFDLVPDMEEHRPIYEKVLRGEVLDFPGTEVRSPNGKRYRELHYRPVRDRRGTVTGIFTTATDITERRRAEEAYAQLHRDYSKIINALPLWIWAEHPESGELYLASPGARTLTGYEPEQFLDDPTLWFNLIPEEDQALAIEATVRARREKVPASYECRIKHKDGSIRWMHNLVIPEIAESDGLTGLFGFSVDITQRKQVEEALRESEQRYRALFDDSRDPIYLTTREGKLVDVNQAALALFGYSREELRHLNAVRLYVNPADRQAFQREIEQEGSVRDYPVKLRRKSGAERDCLITSTVRRASDGTVIGYQSIIRDITERKRAEQALSESREQLRNLAARLHAVREEERTLIAREIHDELGQDLTGLKMDLCWLIKRLPRDRRLTERAHSMATLLDTTLDALRQISVRLRPAVLDDLGLEAAIEWQANELTAHTDIECMLDLQLGELVLDRDRPTAVFRIVQEALTNVARHAQARRVEIKLRTAEGDLLLEVRDDGRGIADEERASTTSLGLIGMRERAGALGGRVDIRRSAERGTVVTLRMPLAAVGAELDGR